MAYDIPTILARMLARKRAAINTGSHGQKVKLGLGRLLNPFGQAGRPLVVAPSPNSASSKGSKVNLNDTAAHQGTYASRIVEHAFLQDQPHGDGWTQDRRGSVSPSAVETAVFSVPAGSVIRLVQGNVQSALTGGGTTVTWSLGTAGDPDKYGTAGDPSPADSLAKNSKSSWAATPTHLTAAEPIVLTGCATGGAAEGDTALTVGSVRVVIVYDTYESLANAA
jgi:hypothetical protein